MYELATKNTDTVRLSASDLDKKVIELKYDFAKALDGLLLKIRIVGFRCFRWM